MDKILIIYSGGMDSFTLVHDTMRTYPGSEVRVLSFNYGQRHVKELQFAMDVCDDLKPGVTHIVMELQGLGAMLSGSSLTSADVAVPEGHYAADNMKLTVVPGRNTIMLSVAMGLAEAWAKPGERVMVFYGAHAGDHTIYPDCRPEYYHEMRDVYRTATEGRVALMAPYIHHTKGNILAIGKRLGLDYAKTWSCYKGGAVPCGKCGACTERTEAFNENDMIDPWWSISQKWEAEQEVLARQAAALAQQQLAEAAAETAVVEIAVPEEKTKPVTKAKREKLKKTAS